jgi:hypothetical protein
MSKAVNLLRKGIGFAMNSGFNFILRCLSPLLVPLVKRMARTGIGTDACLGVGCLPLPVHFYSPVPDIADLERRKVWDKRSALAGIDFQIEKQLALLTKLGQEFEHECNWPLTATDDPHRFYTENVSFSYGCAASLHGILRHYKPHRVIEVGSGNSSLVISAALLMNTEDSRKQRKPEYTIIDPYPRPIIENGLPGLTHLIKERVELLDVTFFDDLKENDVLFIDSGHTVRTGSDVNYLILEVLPILSPGVIVHFHDIALPYEYPKAYATNPQFRMFWTEAYLLQAFLSMNSHFEVMLTLSYLMLDQRNAFQEAFKSYDPEKHRAVSGSFWIRRHRAP